MPFLQCKRFSRRFPGLETLKSALCLRTQNPCFPKTTSGIGRKLFDRVRRLLRAFYQAYDGLFVLNSEQREWFSSDAMGILPERIRQTAH